MKNSKKIFKLSLYLFLFFTLKVDASILKEGVGVAFGVSENAVINYNGAKKFISKGVEKKFSTGAEIRSLSGKVSLRFNEVLNVYLEPNTKMILNKFQFNEEKTYIEIFIPNGEAKFDIRQEDKIELLVRTLKGVVKAR